MAATRKSIRLSSLMKSPQLLFTTIALSSSRGGISVRFVESFSITSYNINHHNHNQQQRRCVHLPASSSNSESSGLSVTGPIYEMNGVTTVKLFTKEGCTLCDKVKDVSLCVYWYIFLNVISQMLTFLLFVIRCLNRYVKISPIHFMLWILRMMISKTGLINTSEYHVCIPLILFRIQYLCLYIYFLHLLEILHLLFRVDIQQYTIAYLIDMIFLFFTLMIYTGQSIGYRQRMPSPR